MRSNSVSRHERTVFDIARGPIGGHPEVGRLESKQFIVLLDLYGSVRRDMKEIAVIAQ